MIINFNRVIPFLAHKDAVIREKASEYLLNNQIIDEKIVLIVLQSLFSFNPRNNLSIIRLLNIQYLNEQHIKQLFSFWKNIAKDKKLKKVAKVLKQLIIEKSSEEIYSIIPQFPNSFHKGIEKIHFENKIYQTLLEHLNEKSSDILWNHINDFVSQNKKVPFNYLQLSQFHLIMEILSRKSQLTFSFKIKIKNYFSNIRKEKIVNPLECYFFLSCVEAFELNHIVIDLFNIFYIRLPNSIYISTLFTISSFKEQKSQLFRKITTIYKDKAIINKNYLIAFFTFFPTKESEFYLKRIAQDEIHPQYLLDIAIAFSDIFSLEFIPLALSLMKNGYDSRCIDLEQELLIYASITGISIPNIGNIAGKYIERKKNIEIIKNKILKAQQKKLKSKQNSKKK